MNLTLREFLSRWGDKTHLIKPVVLGESKTVAIVEQMLIQDTVKPPPPTDLDLLRQKLFEAATRQNFEALSPLDWRHSPFALEGKGGLLEFPDLLKRYLSALHTHQRPRLLRGLAAVYLKNFSPVSESISLLGIFLTTQADRMGSVWAKSHTDYGLFHCEQIAVRLTALLAVRNKALAQSMTAIFQIAGLPPMLAHSPLAILALRKALEGMVRQKKGLSEQEVRHIIALTSDGKEGLAFGGSNVLVEIMTDALLLPLRSTPPAPNVRILVEGHLLHQLKDPRLYPARWLGVKTEAKEIILRWLTEQSLDLFLDIVDEVVNESADAKRMWQNRRLFWRSYLEKGYIDEAWVVLGNEGEQYARNINAKDGHSRLSFGSLSQSTDVKKHIVLMLRVDSLIIVDWSHNGRCHIWHDSHPHAPKLYRHQYTKSQLEFQAEEAITHSASGIWMGRVSKLIYDKTGRYNPF